MNARELLKKGLLELNISCSETQLRVFTQFLSELKKWNKTYNLTALKTDSDIVIKHFIDSLLYLKAVPEGPVRLADAGSGAGFPGMPIKIIRSDIDLTFIEPSRKKASFIRHIVRLFNLTGAQVLEERVENLGTDYARFFDVVTSRATFSMVEFLDAACYCVKKKGVLILNKGPKVSDEMSALKRSSYPNDAIKNVLRLSLPLTDTERTIVVLSCPESSRES